MRRVHVEQRPRDPTSSALDAASALVRSLGWRAPPAWIEVDRDGAIEVLSSAMMNDLVDDAPRMSFREAEERAREFEASCGSGAVFFTNGTLANIRRGFGRHSITPARADGGVIAVSPVEVRMFWILD
jgi:hypothetical protein